MKYLKDYQFDSGELVYLESSYITGISFSNSTVLITGDFCLSVSEQKWKRGVFNITYVNSCDFNFHGKITAGKKGELDFGSPEISVSDIKVKVVLSGGEVLIKGNNLSCSLSSMNERYNG